MNENDSCGSNNRKNNTVAQHKKATELSETMTE